MINIEPSRLWFGTAQDRVDLRALHRQRIRIVIDLAYEEEPVILSRDLVYHRLPLIDGSGNSPELLHHAVEVLFCCLRQAIPTIVCCSAGLSRSPTVAAVALAKWRSQLATDALLEIQQHRKLSVNPQLWDETLRAAKEI